MEGPEDQLAQPVTESGSFPVAPISVVRGNPDRCITDTMVWGEAPATRRDTQQAGLRPQLLQCLVPPANVSVPAQRGAVALREPTKGTWKAHAQARALATMSTLHPLPIRPLP